MKVSEIMMVPPQTCPLETHLESVSRRMRETGCGSLVVLGPTGRVAGIVTERDVALAVGATDDAARLSVDRVMSPEVHACRPEEHVDDALRRMARFHVGRLAVVDETDDVKGVLSIEDIVLWAGGTPGVSMHALIAALRTIYSRTRQIDTTAR